jgi:FAD/FMN-containing dehydrogenase
VGQARHVLRAAYRAEVPVTPRGQGTGNYGQAVAFERGVVLDLTRLKGELVIGDASVTTLAGMRILDIQRQLRRHGRELAVIPSTIASSIGGFLAGGSGGAGSMKEGWIWDGFVKKLWVAGCTEDAAEVEIDQPDVRGFLHNYGTSGILTRAEVTTRPLSPRSCVYAEFYDFHDALAAGREMFAEGVVPWLLCVDSIGVSALLSQVDSHISQGMFTMRAVVSAEEASLAESAIRRADGKVIFSGDGAPNLILSQSFNHVTERYLAARPLYAHLQMSGPGIAKSLQCLQQEFGEADVHLDGFRINGAPAFVGLAFLPFTSPVDIDRAIAALAAVQVRVNSPHAWWVNKAEDDIRSRALTFDPKGLLNPGKLHAAA